MFENQLKTIIRKPTAKVHIGEPIVLEKISGIEDFSKIMHKRKNHETLTQEDRERFSQLSDTLREQSDTVMRKIAEYVPEEKRGTYGKKPE